MNVVEYIAVDINLRNSIFTVINVYVTPDKCVMEGDFSYLFGCKTLIIGDLNAKSKLWGSPQPDQRGLMLEGLIDRHDTWMWPLLIALPLRRVVGLS